MNTRKSVRLYKEDENENERTQIQTLPYLNSKRENGCHKQINLLTTIPLYVVYDPGKLTTDTDGGNVRCEVDSKNKITKSILKGISLAKRRNKEKFLEATLGMRVYLKLISVIK